MFLSYLILDDPSGFAVGAPGPHPQTEARNFVVENELLVEAFYAVDFTPIGKAGIERAKARLVKMGTAARTLASDLRHFGPDVQFTGMWRTYLNNRRGHPLVQRLLNDPLVNDPLVMAEVIAHVAEFCERAAPLYRLEGPIPPVGQPQAHDALKTTVIVKLASVCRSVLHSTVATLANASLNRKDITRSTVQGALP
jgi:hypothetical protein